MKRYRPYIFITAILLALVLPSQVTHAGIFDATAQSFVMGIISWIFITLRAVLGTVIAGLIYILNFMIYARAFADADHVPIVVAIWKILRDLSNMLFILVLIYMAFATIFNTGKYRFQDLIWRLLVAAVLINFSLVIGRFVIDAFQVLNNVFLHSIGNPGDKLGQFLDPAKLVQGKPDVNGFDLLGGAGVGLIFGVILSAMYAFSLLVAVLFATFRIFAIWGLLAVAPVAWMAYILPGTRKWFGMWWSYFFGWNLFLPVYLFVMYIGLVFLSQGRTVIQAVTGSADTPLFGTGNITVNLLFFYIFAAFFLSYGTWMATKMTSAFGGQGFKAGVDWATDRVRKTPGFSSYFAAEKATGARFKQFQQEGFQNPTLNRLYGGEAAIKAREARWRERLGVAGADKQFIKDANGTFERVEEEYDSGKLNYQALQEKVKDSKPDSAEGFAYRKLAIQKGALSDEQFIEALSSARHRPQIIGELINTAKKSKFAGIDKNLKKIVFDSRLQGSEFTAARRQLLASIAEDPKKAAGFEYADIENGVNLLGGISRDNSNKAKLSPEANKFLGDMAKVNPGLVFQFKKDNDLIDKPKEGETYVGPDGEPLPDKVHTSEPLNTKFTAILGALKKTEDIANMAIKQWREPEFQQALGNKLRDTRISHDSRRNLRNGLEKLLLENGEYEKIQILENLAPKILFPKNDPNAPRNPNRARGQRPPRPAGGAGTISYENTEGINQANVVDLRSKKDYEIK